MVSLCSLLIVVYVYFLVTISGLDNGVGLLPAMGFNSWSAFGCDINETVIREITDEFVKLNLHKYGYEYINLDDCWAGGRYSNGSIYANTTQFNASLKTLGDYVRSAGFKFGLYTSRGTKTCAGRPASYGHEQLDANSYSSWGVEYVKEDTCGEHNGTQARCFAEYAKMRDALNNTNGLPIYFSLCGNRAWYGSIGASLGNSWRIAHDDDTGWNWVLEAIDTNAQFNLDQYAGLGAWNDPDMLVANGPHHVFSEGQSRFQFSMWAILAAPLLISCDVRQITQYTLETYTNQHVIDVDQDKFRKQGIRVQGENLALNTSKVLNNTNIWSKELIDGSRAMIFINGGVNQVDVVCDEECFNNAGFFDVNVRVYDYWNDMKFLGNYSTSKPFVVPGLIPNCGFEMYKMVPYYEEYQIP